LKQQNVPQQDLAAESFEASSPRTIYSGSKTPWGILLPSKLGPITIVLNDVIRSFTDTELLKWVPPSCQKKLDSRKRQFMKRKGDIIYALQI